MDAVKMVKSVSKLVLWIIIGAFIGLIIPLLVGCLRGLAESGSSMRFYNGLTILLWLPFSGVMGMFMAVYMWADWIVFFAIFGAITALLTSFLKKKFVPFFSQKQIFIFTTLTILLICVIFSIQRAITINKIETRYNNFCSAIRKRNYPSAYTYLSPTYHQKVSLNEFKELIDVEYGSTFTHACYPSAQLDITSLGNHGEILIGGGLNFSNIFSMDIGFKVEKIDDEWYFSDEPVQYID